MKLALTIVLALIMSIMAVAQSGKGSGGGEVRTELTARLIGKATGKAVWKTRDKAKESEAELEIEGQRLPIGETLTIKVGTMEPITVIVSRFGTIHMEQKFRTKTRPAIAVGTPVAVVDADGTVLLSGAFR